MVAAMSEIEQKYRVLVERISGYPMSGAGRARILAEVEEAYRRERGAWPITLGCAANLALKAVPDTHSARATGRQPGLLRSPWVLGRGPDSPSAGGGSVPARPESPT